jgi:hypothetical protein
MSSTIVYNRRSSSLGLAQAQPWTKSANLSITGTVFPPRRRSIGYTPHYENAHGRSAESKLEALLIEFANLTTENAALVRENGSLTAEALATHNALAASERQNTFFLEALDTTHVAKNDLESRLRTVSTERDQLSHQLHMAESELVSLRPSSPDIVTVSEAEVEDESNSNLGRLLYVMTEAFAARRRGELHLLLYIHLTLILTQPFLQLSRRRHYSSFLRRALTRPFWTVRVSLSPHAFLILSDAV